MNLDAVILAGGKSSRLGGIVPPYFKPFVVVNGQSLLVAAVDAARDAKAERIIVVAAAENALQAWQMVGHYSDVRVVLSDRGVGHAIYVGLELCTADRVLILMSDNVHGDGDVRTVTQYRTAVGVRRVPSKDAERYTRLSSEMRWVEGPDAEISSEPETMIWCGPLVIERVRGLATLRGQQRVGPHLSDIAPSAALVITDSIDIGVPDALTEATTHETDGVDEVDV